MFKPSEPFHVLITTKKRRSEIKFETGKNLIIFIWPRKTKYTRSSSLVQLLVSSRVEERRGDEDGLSFTTDVNLSQTIKQL